MNIVLVNTAHVIDSKGGGERVLCDMANALTERGHKVTVVCCEIKQGRPGFELLDTVDFINAWNRPVSWYQKGVAAKLRSLSLSSRERKRKRALVQADFYGTKIRRALAQSEPDIFICFQLNSALAIKKAYGKRIPIITMLHCNPIIFPILDVLSDEVSQLGLIQVLLPEYAQTVRRKVPDARVTSIPNCVPQYEQTSPLSAPVLINIGRIVPWKRQHLAVEAFALINKRFPEWRLELWGGTDGKGTYLAQLVDRIRELGLQDRVRLCGVTDEVHQRYLDASIFVFPSNHEGFPLALTEAMSCGLAVVGCRTSSGVNSLIRDEENGLLVDATPEGFAHAMERLMSDPSLCARLGAQAHESMKDYRAASLWNRWERLISDEGARHKAA